MSILIEIRIDVKKLEARICELDGEIKDLEEVIQVLLGVYCNSKVAFYTGFPSYVHLKICFDFLGPAVFQVMHRDSRRVQCIASQLS